MVPATPTRIRMAVRTPPRIRPSMRPAPTREPSSAMSTLTATASGVTIECRWILMLASPVASLSPHGAAHPGSRRGCSHMDIDSFIQHYRPEWDRLEQACARGSRGLAKRTGPEIDDLVRLYLRASAHLAEVRTRYKDPRLEA